MQERRNEEQTLSTEEDIIEVVGAPAISCDHFLPYQLVNSTQHHLERARSVQRLVCHRGRRRNATHERLSCLETERSLPTTAYSRFLCLSDGNRFELQYRILWQMLCGSSSGVKLQKITRSASPNNVQQRTTVSLRPVYDTRPARAARSKSVTMSTAKDAIDLGQMVSALPMTKLENMSARSLHYVDATAQLEHVQLIVHRVFHRVWARSMS